MPSFFTFQQGRFRAVPDAHRLGRGRRRSLLGFNVDGFGGAFGGRDDDDEGDVDGCDEEEFGIWKRWGRSMKDLWLEPRQGAVAKAVDKWWCRCLVLVVLPAALAVAWCALPFPQYEFPDDDDVDDLPTNTFGHKIPGHGEARVEINFWFFLLGFPFTVSVIAAMSIAAPIPFYCIPELRYITSHNTAWICWTFFAMAMPLLVAFAILLNHERHLGLRNPLSETQRIFTSSWWTGDTDTINARDRPRRPNVSRNPNAFNHNASLEVALASDDIYRSRDAQLMLRKRWLPASFGVTKEKEWAVTPLVGSLSSTSL
ncbi:hypothetical protein DID88_002320 [Monilinia fructigena]|uniref:Uncharacterized protein n=1 Tax=Monilinia fructigena TaxID=38457 RepID=A0A395IE01_9HELO|nr:hypothetical protein DID88_002320 [Monilinia fructigena]